MNVRAKVIITAEDLVNELNQETLLKLIKGIDRGVAEWGFTLELYRHFEALNKVHEADMAAHDAPARTVGTYPGEDIHE